MGTRWTPGQILEVWGDAVSVPVFSRRLRLVRTNDTDRCLDPTLELLDIRRPRDTHLELPDMPALRWLGLSDAGNVMEFPSFSALTGLSISNTALPSTLPALPALRTLVLSGIAGLQNMADGSKTGQLVSVKIERCRDLRSLPALGSNLHELRIQACPVLACVRSACHAVTVHVSDCPALTKLPALSRARTIRVARCANLQEMPFAWCAEALEIQACHVLHHLPELPKLAVLHIDGADALQELPDLPLAGYVDVRGTPALTHLPASLPAAVVVYLCAAHMPATPVAKTTVQLGVSADTPATPVTDDYDRHEKLVCSMINSLFEDE